MVTVINYQLVAPPSHVTLFRDVTLYCNVFVKSSVVVEVEWSERDYYWRWLKNKCAHDFVHQLVRIGNQYGITIGPNKEINVDRIDYDQYPYIISRLRPYTVM